MPDDPQFIPEWKLDSAAWVLRRKELFKKIGFFALFFFDFVFIYILGISLVNYNSSSIQFKGMIADLARGASAVSWEAVHAHTSPRQLNVVDPTVLPQGGNMYDLYARLVNTNTDWGGLEVVYHFEVNGQPLEQHRTAIAPQESKPVFHFNLERSSAPRTVRVVIDSINWERPESADLVAAQDELQVEQVRFVRGDANTFDRVTFLAVNNSPFGFWQAGFAVVAINGTTPVGVHYITVEDWEAQSGKQAQAVWFHALPGVSRVEVMPDVNVMDLDVVKPISGTGNTPPGFDPDNL